MRIYNSLTRKREEFAPIKKGRIGMYVCGPTVYDEPHIGHARSAYIFDVIRRYLEYKGFKVKFVRNVTDVDDKIIEKARQEVSSVKCQVPSLKEAVKEVSKKYLDAYHEDMELLGIGEPDKEPKATEYIPKMIKFIELLVKEDRAYVADGDVYFDIRKAKDYGKLSHQNLENMEVGARIAPGEKKRDPLDFALWKMSKEDEPSWNSPWGKGRPGWHIECSAMSSSLLGDEFDIHGGGIDLIFPHHENEIAQSEGAGKKFARYWIHNGLLTIRAEKMAKSSGNFISIKDFIAKYKDADYLKLFFLSAHYSNPIDYTEEKIEETKKEKERFGILLDKINRIIGVKVSRCQSVKGKTGKELEDVRKKFEEAMDDDFNTPQGLATIFEVVNITNKKIDDIAFMAEAKNLLFELMGIFGLDLKRKHGFKNLPARLEVLIEKRNEARKQGNFTEADRIRKELADQDIILEDTKEGTVWRQKI